MTQQATAGLHVRDPGRTERFGYHPVDPSVIGQPDVRCHRTEKHVIVGRAGPLIEDVVGERVFYQTPQGRGARLRAYDKQTGANVGEVFIPAPITGGPMTYLVGGKQYIALTVGVSPVPELVAYALP